MNPNEFEIRLRSHIENTIDEIKNPYSVENIFQKFFILNNNIILNHSNRKIDCFLMKVKYR